MIAMLLAAGRGERLRPLTDSLPKALVEVAGVSLIERHLRRLAQFGVTVVVINLGWLGEQIVARVGSGKQFGLQVIYSPEHEQILETGGGIQRALPLLGNEPFWVINADIFIDFAVRPAAIADDVLAHLVLVPMPAWRDHGDFQLQNARVTNGVPAPLTFSGVACYRPAFFADCPAGRFSVVPWLRRAADRGVVSGERHEGFWADAGTPQRLAELDRKLRS
jgi:MurNAc alpha-1-phosphate uridylyltransferase